MTAPRRGLSLVEVLVVLFIIAILIGLFLPAVRRVREPAARAACQNNLKQIMIGLHAYHDVHGRLPPGCVGPSSVEPAERLSWITLILPYVERDDVACKLDPEAGYSGNEATKQPIKLFWCPSAKVGDPSDALTTYYGCGGVGTDAPSLPVGRPGVGLFGYDRQLRLMSDVTDGTSNTFALLESHDQPGPWAQGGSATTRGIEPTFQIKAHERGIMNVGMADGSVRAVQDVPFARLAAAATVAGGEKIDLD